LTPARSGQRVRFGPFEMDMRAGELHRDGATIRLPKQPFQILRALLEKADEMVTREEIRAAVWRNGTIVEFEHGINAAVRRLRELLGDDASHPAYIETVPQRGYRFVAPVAEVCRPAPMKIPAVPEPGPLPIVVLPFENTSAEPEADYLAEGIGERLINALSQLQRLRVIPRCTAFRFRGREKDLERVARELGVRVVLTGRVSLLGEKLVVSAELIDVPRDAQLWGGRYIKQFSDLFTVEEDLAREIAAGLRVQLTSDEKKRLVRRGTGSREAYRLFPRAQHQIHKWTPQGTAPVR
jgi:TolB-like protein